MAKKQEPAIQSFGRHQEPHKPSEAKPAEAKPTGAKPAEAKPAEAKGKAPPAEAKPTRADITDKLLTRPKGVSIKELTDAYETEFGIPGKVTTARQALVKVPKARGYSTALDKSDSARGTVWRRVVAQG